MKIAVIGAGGVGGYFGGRLALAGHDVHFLARGRHLDAMRSNGLVLECDGGPFVVRSPNVTDDPRALGNADVVLNTVKLWDLAQSGRDIAGVVGSQSVTQSVTQPVARSVVIPLQNGVEAIDLLADGIPREQIAGGVAYIAATIREPGVIAVTGTMARLRFGPMIESQRPVLQSFAAACITAEIDADISIDIRRTLWEKFIFLNAFSGVTAVSRRPAGVVRGDPHLRDTIEASMLETLRLAHANGIALPHGFVDAQMKFLDTLPEGMRSSMLNDLVAGNRLEAPWLCGAVTRMYEARGSHAPINRTLYAALKPFVNGGAALDRTMNPA